jgi:hypothetical protein
VAVTHALMAILLAYPLDAPALPDAELLNQAEVAFQQGVSLRDAPSEARPHFLRAAESYEELRRRGADNAALAHDLGNSYLLAGDLPRAIFAYRRGLVLAPHDLGLQEALRYARGQVAFPSGGSLGRPPVDQRPPWLPRLPSPWYLGLALTAYTAGWLAAARWWMTRRGRLLGAALACFALGGILLMGLAAEENRAGQVACRPIVVIADDGVLVRAGNGLAYPPRYETPLQRGVEARLLFARGGWLQIELADGEVGWIPRMYAVVDES